MITLRGTVLAIAKLPADQLDKLAVITDQLTLAKGDFFIAEGQVPRKMGFVRRGLFRYFYSDNQGNQFTKGFFSEGSFLSSYSAMIQNRPSYFAIEALEDSALDVIDFAKWQKLFPGHPEWQTLRLALLEKGFIKKETREREFLLFDAEERYRRFMLEYPGLEDRVRQHLIASYLGITSVALSRIRGKMKVH